ncbi:unnamed protein product [Paramecium sonneborni]|uniref:Uncharacterized protein n=1 Tax=Paramecium sonneborni TaxID=65129 RepID=A0A8S1R6E2_9CILI|nr:unnamed protein product [Paramecium sonneborni]
MKENQKFDEIKIYKIIQRFQRCFLQKIFPTCFLNKQNRQYQQYKKKLQKVLELMKNKLINLVQRQAYVIMIMF